MASDTRNGTPDFEKLSGDLYRNWEKAMTSWWDQVLESPAFLGAMGQNLATQSQARATYEKSVDETMEKLHLPTRKDLVRVARIATLLEERLLAQEDLLLAMKDRLADAEREAVRARVEAAEARLEIRETLAALRGDVEALHAAPQRSEGPSAASPGPAPTGAAPRRGKNG